MECLHIEVTIILPLKPDRVGVLNGLICFSTSPPLVAALPTPSTPQSPFRLRRNSHNSPKGRPKTLEPHPQRAPDLIDDLISTVSSVVSEDCRFRIKVPRLAMPPNALQAAVLDVATLMAKMQANEAKVLSALGFAMIPAFYTFGAEMQPRILAFFEDAILRGMLDDLRLMQGDQPKTAGFGGLIPTLSFSLEVDNICIPQAIPSFLIFKSSKLLMILPLTTKTPHPGSRGQKALLFSMFWHPSPLRKLFRYTTYPHLFRLSLQRSSTLST